MTKKLFVGGLPFTYTNAELQALFASAGKVLSAEMVPDPAWGRTRGFGFVEMSTPVEFQAAIATLNGMKVGEKNIYVTEAREKKPSPGAPPASRPAGQPLNRKAGRVSRPRPPEGSALPYDRPPRTSGSFNPDRSRFQSRPPQVPGAFGKSRKSFNRPVKWEPRDDGKRSFSAPRHTRGDFGPGNRKPGASPAPGFGENRHRPAKPFRKPSGPSQSSKNEFWRKFEKKKQ